MSGDLDSHYDQNYSALIENGIAIEDIRVPEADPIASYLEQDQSKDAGRPVTGKISCCHAGILH